jgi:hypothetical protein
MNKERLFPKKHSLATRFPQAAHNEYAHTSELDAGGRRPPASPISGSDGANNSIDVDDIALYQKK